MTRWLFNSRRSTTDDLRRIPVHDIVTHGLNRRGMSFSWAWWTSEGRTTASVGARVEGDENEAYLHLDYTLNGAPMRQRIRLEALPCRFGGVRWLAFCPRTGRSVAHLYMGHTGALSRHAYRLKFGSQRESPLDRSFRRRNRALEKLKTNSPLCLSRPKGMHWRTYGRLLHEISKETQFFDVAARARFGFNVDLD
ncbi:hypothetical protein OGR47_11435 [Methylocystis sp. MJC1]|uniref:hypothetical protein n=1 Tax=Methylocystis sp. MJC1 TaxID=2654282 RepID=UPI0013EAAB26|nr:hypothetical protein [Methylocystis sp. MJC1]MBU6527594.1 hypothetical protein [Methylocystis sp. MJC1]UZX10533.1 hypothetical protein OGR47_11435 [Methylocystis sp. MJC1]